jgi:membrane dipeptidase
MPIFDLHADVFMDLVRRCNSSPELESRHLLRMKRGNIFGAVLLNCRMAGETAEPADFERFIEKVRKELNAAGDSILLVDKSSDIERALSEMRFAVIIGYEGLNPAGGDASWIGRLYKEAGLRVATLTHNDDNPFGHGALGLQGGLSEIGRQAVSTMNDLGILIDMAHASRTTRAEILDCSKRPVMLSHTSAAALYDTGRNLSDAEMKVIANRGGLIGCMTSPAALAPLDDVAHRDIGRYIEHLTHMIRIAGVDHVGLGMHFCEYLYSEAEYPPVRGLEDASCAKAILQALEVKGYSDSDIEKIAWKNFVRVFAG